MIGSYATLLKPPWASGADYSIPRSFDFDRFDSLAWMFKASPTGRLIDTGPTLQFQVKRPVFYGTVTIPTVDYRANVLDAIEDFSARDGDEEFSAAMNVNRAISDLITAERGRDPTRGDRDLRAPLEKAIDAFDNRSEECPLLEADPVIKALDALIAACRAAR